MSAVASHQHHLVDALCEGTLQQALAAVEEAPELKALYRAYLERFGERCMEELKLESATLHDDPLPLLRAVGGLARRTESPAAERSATAMVALRKQAEERAAAALRGRPLRRLIFGAVVRGARVRVRDRENLRFERTRVFGRARRIFVELGRRYFALGLLDDPRDIFYLEAEEALGYVEGTATCNDLRGLAAVRKTAFAGYREESLPNRFETHGIPDRPALGQRSARGSERAERANAPTLAGTPCCPGVVRGRVRVVADPRNVWLAPGEILAAERTDPGWIMLFPAAAGLLVERGSLLSHSAIVARELGLPAIVGLEGLSEWLRDGDWVEMDGSAGVVRKVDPAVA
jgi:rifampicin phosphotransferase